MSSFWCRNNMLCLLFMFTVGFVSQRKINALPAGENKDLHNLFNYFELTTLHHVAENLNSDQQNKEARTQDKNLYFQAYNKTFELSLSESKLPVQPIIQIYGEQGLIKEYTDPDEYSSSNLYEGRVKGDGKSNVLGFFQNGVFSGTVETGNSTYYLEPSQKFFGNTTSPLSIVVYRNTDVKYNDLETNRRVLKDELTFTEDYDLLYKTHFKSEVNRFKREVMNDSSIGWPEKACVMELVADHTLYDHMGKNVEDTVKVLRFYAKMADTIFRQTDFDEDGFPDEIRLLIGKVTVITDPRVPGYNLGSKTTDSREFISKFSRRVQDFCISICFCHRGFKEGVVGLAYRADPENRGIAGGICQPPILMGNGVNYTTNTAFVSSLSENGILPLFVSCSSFVHELGHSFGSHHDPEENPLCSPGGEWGNYLMTPYIIDGSKPHHSVFSPCSKRSMKRVIERKGICLEPKKLHYCGNGITEIGEECDCGTEATCDFVDPCCTPKGGIGEDKQCTFRRSRGYQCSWVDSPCCDKNCHIVSAAENRICTKDASLCRESICDGKSAVCPPGKWKQDGSPCKGGSHTCRGGMCNSTICLDAGLQDCLCQSDNSEISECLVCCYDIRTKRCTPAELYGYTTPQGNNFVKYPGSSCNDGRGKCDAKGRCVMAQSAGKGDIIINWSSKTWPNILMTALCILTFIGTVTLFYRQRSVLPSTVAPRTDNREQCF